ncbi:MAG TPA: tRNA (adenosine(37)-N6)-threonylcarbamoyltransferase complex dimerization subunit type 1 TsaB [Stellaceae bacterium]|nr:tRNA (adenosine(37)-N6)-threonylcarbamoyltransferase complex dimerization subunit type 1 TsaB [Stellaceae bacterium]
MVTALGLDCAGRGCAAAVLVDGEVRARRSLPMERGQAEALMPLIAAVLAESGCAPAALHLVAVTIGPGTFTGLRIGIAAARGLALAVGVPAIGITSFAAIAAAVPPARRGARSLVVALDSKREELYLQSFAPHGPALDAGALVAPDEAAGRVPAGRLLLAGDGAERLGQVLGVRAELVPETAVPDPADVARLGIAAWKGGAALPPRPLYLRAPETSRPRRPLVPR